MNRARKTIVVCLMCLLLTLTTACRGMQSAEPESSMAPLDWSATPAPASTPLPTGEADLPASVEMVDGIPQILVYHTATKQIEPMNLEAYVMGVLAGEMRNDWPMEALKAQAVLARTFVLKFISEKQSIYEGADISTDIKEAQAYNAESVNERIERAVKETSGVVMLTQDGEFPYAWFHAHAGGMTELASVGLEYKEGDPDYLRVVESPDSEKAPTNVKNWTVSFSADEVAKAATATGVKTESVSSINLGKKGESGRVATLLINGQNVSAPALRLQLGSTELKSTLIRSVSLENGKVTFTGSGYGHGVGMSQWGAYAMAEEGKSYEQIIHHYFRNVSLASAWE